jgi:ribosomal protection tetracycline resistance protein
MTFLNLGILAHVDAGKTSLTEQVLYQTGVIHKLGSVDAGTTQTDTLALEQQRGITIKSAVAAFALDELAVNLIDTPGHPDFIAEVERVLSVLDGAVLVISAVEGVQAQTRVVMRALRRLRIPTLFFINKIDRRGAREAELLDQIKATLTPAILPLGRAHGLGTREAQFTPFDVEDEAGFRSRLVDRLSEHDDDLLALYLGDERALSPDRLRAELAAQTRRALLHPVFFGSAITGAGVPELLAGVKGLLPAVLGTVTGPPAGSVFKIERGPAGEKIAYLRLTAGALHVRDRVPYGRGQEGRVTALQVYDRGPAARRAVAVAGQIAKVWGLSDVRIGDRIGHADGPSDPRLFAPPTLETQIVPRRSADRGALHAALTQLTEQDPLINLRQGRTGDELFVSLYGEVQKEVIQETLVRDFGLEADCLESTVICVERVQAEGEDFELIFHAPNPFAATVGLRVAPAPPGSGITYQLAVELGSLPLSFHKAVEMTVRETLHQGLFGWEVIDCVVTMTRSGFSSPRSTAGDFRLLTPLVFMSALQRAGTLVHEPIQRFRLELPADTLDALFPLLARLGAEPEAPSQHGQTCALEGLIPAAHLHTLQQQLPGVSRGEGVLEAAFDHYAPVRGTPPTRARTDHNPLDWKQYLLHVVRRV